MAYCPLFVYQDASPTPRALSPIQAQQFFSSICLLHLGARWSGELLFHRVFYPSVSSSITNKSQHNKHTTSTNDIRQTKRQQQQQQQKATMMMSTWIGVLVSVVSVVSVCANRGKKRAWRLFVVDGHQHCFSRCWGGREVGDMEERKRS